MIQGEQILRISDEVMLLVIDQLEDEVVIDELARERYPSYRFPGCSKTVKKYALGRVQDVELLRDIVFKEYDHRSVTRP